MSNLDLLASSPAGQLVSIEQGAKAFVPAPLPRELVLDMSMVCLLDEATRAVATLAGVGETIPNPGLLIRPFVRREAMLSLRIEGTLTSLSEVFRYESSDHKSTGLGVHEVTNYVFAFERGITLLDDLPLCLRVINELHEMLMNRVRGADKQPGEIRSRQNWIGPSEDTPIEQARYVPPPPTLVRNLLQDLEEFINLNGINLPPLVQCALMHYQFEAIHPYLDGNGRIGRLLIVLFLYSKGILPKPLLFLSAYFERTKDRYYHELFNLSATGDWDGWLQYFLRGCIEQAQDAVVRIRRVREWEDKWKETLRDNHLSGNAFRLLEELSARPVITAPQAAEFLGMTPAGARRILDKFEAMGMVVHFANDWPHMFIAMELLDLIDAPTLEEATV